MPETMEAPSSTAASPGWDVNGYAASARRHLPVQADSPHGAPVSGFSYWVRLRDLRRGYFRARFNSAHFHAAVIRHRIRQLLGQ